MGLHRGIEGSRGTHLLGSSYGRTSGEQGGAIDEQATKISTAATTKVRQIGPHRPPPYGIKPRVSCVLKEYSILLGSSGPKSPGGSTGLAADPPDERGLTQNPSISST